MFFFPCLGFVGSGGYDFHGIASAFTKGSSSRWTAARGSLGGFIYREGAAFCISSRSRTSRETDENVHLPSPILIIHLFFCLCDASRRRR
ncbi:unnamed protein product [Victoria cruziana]